MKIVKPLRNLRLKGHSNISQMFGENQLSDYKEIYGYQGHNGIDLVKPVRSCVFSSHCGVITKTNEKADDAGIYVRLMSNPFIFNNKQATIETCYFHLLDVNVNPGNFVYEGEIIGHLDNTGRSTGPHLHFGLRPYYKNVNNLFVADIKNGYGGYINPYQYLINAKEPMINIIGNNKTKEQYVYGDDQLLHKIHNEQFLIQLHNSGIVDKNNVKWVDDIKKYQIGNDWAALLTT